MNPCRSPLLRGYLLSILGFIMILGSYFLPPFEGNCSEFSGCGPISPLGSGIISNLQYIHTLRNLDSILGFSVVFFVSSAPLLMAILFVMLGWLYTRHKSRILLNTLLIIWAIGFIDFSVSSLLVWGLMAYPLFGFWGIVLGYGILFYVYTIWGWHAKTNKQVPTQS